MWDLCYCMKSKIKRLSGYLTLLIFKKCKCMILLEVWVVHPKSSECNQLGALFPRGMMDQRLRKAERRVKKMDCGDSYFRVGDLVMLIPANISTSFKAGTSFNVCAFPYALNIRTGSASACTKHCTKKALCNSVTLRFAYMHIMGITVHQGMMMITTRICVISRSRVDSVWIVFPDHGYDCTCAMIDLACANCSLESRLIFGRFQQLLLAILPMTPDSEIDFLSLITIKRIAIRRPVFGL